MNFTNSIAKQFREVYLDGTWIATNLKKELQDLSWEAAITKVGSLNTIAALAFHLNYYLSGLIKVYKVGTLDIKDKYSFDLPPISSQDEWVSLQKDIWQNSEELAQLISALPEKEIFAPFVEEKYGTNYRNITGMIEHGYYHLGQIVILKKLIIEREENS